MKNRQMDRQTEGVYGDGRADGYFYPVGSSISLPTQGVEGAPVVSSWIGQRAGDVP